MKRSPYATKIKSINARLLGRRQGEYLQMIKGMQRRKVSILTQLRTGHAPLHGHLFKIGKADSENCPNCPNVKETVKHFLIDCPKWKEKRKTLERMDARRSKEVKHLLGNIRFVNETLRYVDETGRFQGTHGAERQE